MRLQDTKNCCHVRFLCPFTHTVYRRSYERGFRFTFDYTLRKKEGIKGEREREVETIDLRDINFVSSEISGTTLCLLLENEIFDFYSL